jgi:flagellar basal-body rod modification protein FlgD
MIVPPVTDPQTGMSSSASSSKLSENFDDFLTLLTTQLQHQDPLEPMDSAKFTEQLTQFSSVEQAIATNQNLEALISMQNFNQSMMMSTAAVSYLGHTVEVNSDTAELANGSAEWTYVLPEGVEKSQITIFDENDKLVYTTQGATAQGDQAFAWDGLDSNGVPLADGNYRMSVTAVDAEGESVPVSTYIKGTATSVDSADGALVIVVNGVRVPIDKVISVYWNDQA